MKVSKCDTSNKTNIGPFIYHVRYGIKSFMNTKFPCNLVTTTMNDNLSLITSGNVNFFYKFMFLNFGVNNCRK